LIVQALINTIKATPNVEILRLKNGLRDTFWSYNLKVVMINMRIDGGSVTELQACPEEMFKVRMMMHPFYKFARSTSIDDFV